MDRFTRNYLIGLGMAVVIVTLLWVISSWDPDAARLNDLLESDRGLAAYPYQFRVAAVKDGIATMKSPRTFEVPVTQFLAVLDPQLAAKGPDHPDVVAAQERLAHHQKRAQQIVQEDPEVKAVRWILDREWYTERGVTLP